MLKIMTDRESYIPGETVLLSAETNSSIEYGGLDYVVKNPNGDIVFSGTIFPNTEFSVVHKQGSGQIFPFSTNLFMSAVNPVYGTYTVNSTINPKTLVITHLKILLTQVLVLTLLKM